MRLAKAAAVMTPADQANQKLDAPFSVCRVDDDLALRRIDREAARNTPAAKLHHPA
jgi:hypothetical protein